MSFAPTLEAGGRIGDYQIIGNIGTAGTGELFEVEHCVTKRREAMKVLRADIATQEDVTRFEREVAAHAKLSHPNIAALHNAFRVDGNLVLVMELVEGTTLESLLEAHHRAPLEICIAYTRQLLGALGYVHKHQIIHRHVTPASLTISSMGQVKLTNFGLAKSFEDQQMTTHGSVLGSLPYTAPEQLKSAANTNPQSDLYAAGVILYEMLTGVRPFAEHRLVAVLTEVEEQPPPPSTLVPGVSAEWDRVIAKAIARDPRDRYKSAEEFSFALDGLIRPPRKYHALMPYAALGLTLVGCAFLIRMEIRRFGAPEPPSAFTVHVQPPDFAYSKANASAAKERKARKPSVRRTRTRAHVAATPSPVKGKIYGLEPVAPAAKPQQRDVDAASPVVTMPPPVAAPEKKKFWKKLMPFKKKAGDPSAGKVQ